MDENKKKYFPSKLILFGEYTVIKGSDVLAIPLQKFNGFWFFDTTMTNDDLLQVGYFLNKINWKKHNVKFNFSKYHEDIKRGLIFNSTIKTGYGSGSSGALTAAIFYSYFDFSELSIIAINSVLSEIESFFHGSSSGIDPMVSYFNNAIKYSKTEGFEILKGKLNKFKNYSFYLLDSGKKRSTKEYVEIFNNKCEENEFIEEYLKPLIDYNNLVIESFLNVEEEMVFELFENISQIQYLSFKEMIITDLEKLWRKYQTSSDISIKLCGAGGGGYYLIMAKKDLDIFNILKGYKIIQILDQ